jgi:hypothetical protein
LLPVIGRSANQLRAHRVYREAPGVLARADGIAFGGHNRVGIIVTRYSLLCIAAVKLALKVATIALLLFGSIAAEQTLNRDSEIA